MTWYRIQTLEFNELIVYFITNVWNIQRYTSWLWDLIRLSLFCKIYFLLLLLLTHQLREHIPNNPPRVSTPHTIIIARDKLILIDRDQELGLTIIIPSRVFFVEFFRSSPYNNVIARSFAKSSGTKCDRDMSPRHGCCWGSPKKIPQWQVDDKLISKFPWNICQCVRVFRRALSPHFPSSSAKKKQH